MTPNNFTVFMTVKILPFTGANLQLLFSSYFGNESKLYL